MANTIQDKLAYLEQTKGLIKQAIVAKGVEVKDTDTFRSYANKIEAIQSGGGSITGAPSGIKFAYSTFTTVPTEIIPYLEQQTDLSSMFAYCRSLQTVPLLNVSNVTIVSSMFSGCSSLTTLQLFNISYVFDMSYMFYDCHALKTVPHFDTSQATNMSYMFYNCDSLQTVPQFNLVNVRNLSSIFGYCSSLQTVPLLNFSSVTNVSYIFKGCSSLTNLGGFTGLKEYLNLRYSPLLTVDSVMNIINNAADMTSEPKTLTLHKDVFAKLSQEQIATATAKGWNIASA